MARRIQLRRDTAANWLATNPTLAQGEVGVDLTSNKIKIGNGTSAWNSLSYFDDSETSLSNYAGHIIPSTDNTYDLGAPDKQWRDIFVSEGSIYIGDIKLSNDNGTLLVQRVTDAGLVTEEAIPGTTGIVTTDRLVNGDSSVILNSAGTMTTTSLLPKLFTATVDSSHYAGEGSLTLTGDAWYFAVEFRVNADGSVETVITNNTPWPSNPGYANDMPFEFTEADHGIPGYTFTLTLVSIQNPGPFMYTTNLTASVPPALPATVSNPEAVKLTADIASWTFSADGNIKLPAGGDIVDSNGNTVLGGGTPGAIAQGIYEVSIDSNGVVRYPGDITQSHQDNTTCSAGVDTVIYTATGQFQHAIKLFVMVEGTPDGGTSWETQACDIIAVRGFVDDIVHVTAYGITYSSASAFATFDGQWNATTNRIEITCRPTSATNNVVASVHAIEMTSND